MHSQVLRSFAGIAMRQLHGCINVTAFLFLQQFIEGTTI